jgi:hypothetical protein
MFTIFLKFFSCCVLPGASRVICTHFHTAVGGNLIHVVSKIEVQVARDPELNLGNYSVMYELPTSSYDSTIK